MTVRARSSLVPATADVLRQRTVRSDPFRVQSLITRLFAECEREHGVGLAAPQIGVGERVAVVRTSGLRIALVNATIHRSLSFASDVDEEGCISLSGRRFAVRRRSRVTVTTHVYPEPFTFTAVGFLARVVQHELDHLDGICIDQRGREVEVVA